MHPIRIEVAADDLHRTRLTVFFRVLLAIPHYIWITLWGIAVVVAAIVAWFATLACATMPTGLHEFIGRYVRYSVQLEAYLLLAADPYPPFDGRVAYPVTMAIDPPQRQNRWTVGFRALLAVPALILAGVLTGASGPSGGYARGTAASLGVNFGLAWAAAFFAWFVCVATARTSRGLRDVALYSIRYAAQAWCYALLLTDRYPHSGPEAAESTPSDHPVRLSGRDELRRSRLTTAFRAPLLLPHIVWLLLWTLVALFAALANWVVALVRGTGAEPLHRFLAAYVRYQTQVFAFGYLVANPFPGFEGAPRYPVTPEMPGPARQNRWKTGFRLLLAVPALVLSGSLSSLACVCALYAWFVSLALGRTRPGLRDAGAYYLRYNAQVLAYLFLLTERYPYSGPISDETAEEVAVGEAAVAA